MASVEQAIQLFQQAIAIDPRDAPAYMGIADAYALMTGHGQIPYQTGTRAGEEAANKAIALDPSLAEAHAALGLLKCVEWDPQACAAEYQRAIQLNPSYDRAYVRLGTLRFIEGDFAGAERLIRQSETLNPYSQALPMIRAELYDYARRYQDALDLSHKVQRVDPKNSTAPRVEARALHAMGKDREALETISQLLDPASPSAAEGAEIAPYLFNVGRRAQALKILDGVVKGRGRDYVDALALALGFAAIHDRNQTLAWLERALAEHSPDIGSARWDPVLDFVRTDPRYIEVMRQFTRNTAI